MEAELMRLIASIGTTVVGAMATDAYTAVKDRVGALLRRGGGEGREEPVLRELDELRSDLSLARARGDEAGAADIEADVEMLVRSRLRRLLTEQPSLAGELRDLLTETGNAVTNGTMAVGSQVYVSNVYNHYHGGEPAIPQPSLLPAAAPLPRITLGPTRHYQNNVELLLRMDAVWENCRAAKAPTTMYLHGVPGIGTSATVREWLHRHQEELAGCPQLHASLGRDAWGNLPEPAAVLERWFSELGVPVEDIPADPGARSAYFRLLAARGPIVVLLEDVVLASQVEPLLPNTADSVVLITSSSRLPKLVRTLNAEPFEVGPLSSQHSRRLLVSVGRIGSNEAGYEKELDLIADECRGLPLALCIAGAQLAVGHPGRVQELAAELSDRRTRLGALNMEEELSSALDPGYRALAPDAAAVYRCIGLHPAEEFEVDLVRAMLPDMDAAARNRALQQLTFANLIEPTGDGGYRVRHRLIHDHAHACALADEPVAVREAILDRIIGYRLEFAERMEAALSPRYRHDPAGTYAAYAPTGTVDAPALIASLERRRESLENVVRLAHEKGRHQQTWRLTQGLHTFYLKCGLHSPWITTHELAVKSAQECGDTLALARMYFELGFAHLDRWSTLQGDPEAARRYFERALELVRPEDGNATEEQRRTESSVLEGLGLAERKLGNPAQALAYYALGVDALEGIEHRRGHALFALHRGVAYTDLRRHDEAARELRSARRQFARLPVPDPYNEARALTRYAEDRRAAERPGEAVQALDDAIEIMTVNGPPYQRAGIHLLRGDLRDEQGDRRAARQDWTAARDLFLEANSLRAQEADQRLTDTSEADDEDESQGDDVE
ncbi:tetratricopeptide repeat protein [Streptomyces ipomoeae]|uniref:Tetratricopeptide repeat protein n=1 Tax=Streptomyces ipomoeae 91-03 TaxID=698759 RepID=L1KNQ4_9ACTN|nr:tetratricopeptide repeat protein [Streptomyces ipomoeae]EKX62013.1 tetratricopeptide repeat protein [Streptomyces ipomoeae 91-03]MDX2695429.1 tetratricopeptide repeat protein [Streptomyces ipomoeae]MDX2837896.1 tetratricopeptide repeat protein [Streptomyces ipomoeae]